MPDTSAQQPAPAAADAPALLVEDPHDIPVSEMVPGEHRWFGLKLTHGVLPCCRWCGIVRRRDGRNKACPGIVRMGPRAEACHA